MMTGRPPGEITALLDAIRHGDDDAKERLVALVYGELRDIAGSILRQQGEPASLHPTLLVHEAYLRLERGGVFRHAPNRRFFFAAVAQAMRQFLVDHARRRQAEKRGAGRPAVALDALVDYFERDRIDIVALHDALGDLAEADPRLSEVVMLRFFGGFSVAEVAEYLGVSVSTVESDYRLARAWLRRYLRGDDE